MQKNYKILGIDLGGCMSGNSAYIYATVSDGKIKLHDAFKEPKHKEHLACHNFLLDACNRYRVDAIAIDAPLSLPLPLYIPDHLSPPREGSGEIINPYLYRHTDYYLYKSFGLRPMPPAGDRIGRLTARAIALLQACDYHFPNITLNGQRLPIYEVYPKQIAQQLHLGKYKTDPSQLFEQLGIERIDHDEHLLDAMLCVYGGYRILTGHTTMPPENVKSEGWCFPVL